MAEKVATSVLVLKPDAKLLATDAYGTPPETASEKVDINYTGLLKGTTGTLTSLIKGKKLTTSDLKKVGTVVQKEVKFTETLPTKADPTKVTEKLSDKVAAVPVPTAEEKKRLTASAGTTVSNDTLTSATGYLREIAADPKKRNEIQKDGVTVLNLGKNTNTGSAVSVANSISKVSGTKTFAGLTDSNAKMALGLSYLDQAIALGIPQLVDDALKAIDDKKLAKKRLNDSVRSVIQRGDIKTLLIIKGNIGASGILAKVPDAISLLLKSYRFPQGSTAKDHLTLRAELIGMLSTLNPLWDKTKRGSVTVTDYSVFYRISSNSKTLLLLTEVGFATYIAPISVAPRYYQLSLSSIARQMYPKMALFV